MSTFLDLRELPGLKYGGLVTYIQWLEDLEGLEGLQTSENHCCWLGRRLIQNQIDPIFARLEAQTSVYRSAYNTTHPFYSESPARLQNIPSVPTIFKNLFLARDSLDEVVQWMFHILDMEIHVTPDPSTVSQIRALLDDWHLAFKTYTTSLGDHSHLELRTASALEIHYRILSIMLEVSSAKTESIYDSYLGDFRALVQQCEDIIKYRECAPARSWAEYDDRMSLFEFDFGMIAPLFLIACHAETQHSEERLFGLCVIFTEPKARGCVSCFIRDDALDFASHITFTLRLNTKRFLRFFVVS